jgi:hypothetical protein
MWLWILLTYLAGASFMVRRKVLQMQQWEEQDFKAICRDCRATSKNQCRQHDAEGDGKVGAVLLVPVFWPFVLMVWLWWKMLFPRGVRTKTSITRFREQALEARNKALTANLKKQAEEIKELSKAAGLYVPEGL